MGEWNGGVMISAVTSQQEGPMFESNLGPFCLELACSPCIHVAIPASSYSPNTCMRLGYLVILN